MTDALTTRGGGLLPLEHTAEWLRIVRGGTDYWRFRVGLRLLRVDRSYGAGAVDKLAGETGFARATLYERMQVVSFLLRWRGSSARRTFSDFPTLTWSHVRRALRMEFEDAIDALLHAADEALTVDAFGIYCAKLEGKPVPAAPLFDQSGIGYQVFTTARRLANGWWHKRVRITIREVEQ